MLCLNYFSLRWDSRSPSPTYNYYNRRQHHRSPPKRKQTLDPVAKFQSLAANFKSYQKILEPISDPHKGGEGGGGWQEGGYGNGGGGGRGGGSGGEGGGDVWNDGYGGLFFCCIFVFTFVRFLQKLVFISSFYVCFSFGHFIVSFFFLMID